jgi:hypothetical protein
MVQLFKSPTEKADDEFQKAYEKGVNLGRAYWPTAVSHFQEASARYAEGGNSQKANETKALALLFSALTSKNPELWAQVSKAMSNCGDAQLNVGFSANAQELAKESLVLSKEYTIMAQFTPDSAAQSQVADLRDLAQKYLELVGGEQIVWKLTGQSIDPQRRAYYLLGLASLVEANSIIGTDPKKSASLLSEAVAQLDLAGDDYRNVRPSTLQEMQNATKMGKCWFCGREVQGLTFHYVALKADITGYTRSLYGSEMPATMEGDNILACMACYSSVKNVSDQIASMYYQRTMQEIRTLSARVSDIENRLSRLESRAR